MLGSLCSTFDYTTRRAGRGAGPESETARPGLIVTAFGLTTVCRLRATSTACRPNNTVYVYRIAQRIAWQLAIWHGVLS